MVKKVIFVTIDNLTVKIRKELRKVRKDKKLIMLCEPCVSPCELCG
ncbi:hypothetical protein L1276_003125 [Flavobacterium sp. HSC-32F16]|nr:hypothetical protein [Flavobacterium sp. HSC-32F16]